MASIVTDTTNTTTSAISGQDILNEIINYKNNGNEEYKQILKYMKELVNESNTTNNTSIQLQIEQHQKQGIKYYSKGIDVKTIFTNSNTSEGHDMVKEIQIVKSKIFLNRSLIFHQRNKYQKALHDCKSSIQFDKTNIKAYYRAAKILIERNHFTEAYKYVKKGIISNGKDLKNLSIEKQKLLKPLIKLKKEMEKKYKDQIEMNKNNNNNSILGKKNNKTNNPLLGKLHKLSTDEEHAEANKNNSDESKLLKKMKKLANKHGKNQSATSGMIEKTFIALMDSKEFQRRIYPGLELPEGSNAPKNLKELLNDPRYQKPLEDVMPKVLEKAETVLTNVKKKGAAVGDIMDLETENMLRPQILMEAFAREITGVVNRTAANVAKQYAMLAAEIADPEDERASYDLITESALANWNNPDQGFCVIDNFINEVDDEYDDTLDENKIEWSKIVQNDLKRLYKNKKFMPYSYDNYGRPVQNNNNNAMNGKQNSKSDPIMPYIAWLNSNDEMKEKYPAIFEICESLQSLAFELNKKSKEDLKLINPTNDQFLITYLPVGCEMAPRYDGQNGDVQNGIVTTATYFPYDMNNGDVYMGLALTNGREIKIDIKTERVVLHRSLKNMNGISKIMKQKRKENIEEETNYLIDSECDGLFYISVFFSSKKGGDQMKEYMKKHNIKR